RGGGGGGVWPCGVVGGRVGGGVRLRGRRRGRAELVDQGDGTLGEGGVREQPVALEVVAAARRQRVGRLEDAHAVPVAVVVRAGAAVAVAGRAGRRVGQGVAVAGLRVADLTRFPPRSPRLAGLLTARLVVPTASAV